ncbi:hypothetical protein [Streptomyces griseofuscus]|uniref:hypothetical protein n=1 Tax=Streptomyces griseofuscus TaxID=146922 RepID=UPI0036A7F1A3
MPLPITSTAISDAKEHALKSWYQCMDIRGLTARIPDWRTRTAPDGSPVLSVEVAGPGAAHALALFSSNYHLTLPNPGDLRPQYDIDTPGRTVLVWRYAGVWVELWHPDTIPTQPAAVQADTDPALVSASTGRPLFGPGGRLTFTRRPKETTA